MKNAKLKIVVMALALACLLMGVVIAQLIVTRQLQFGAHIKTVGNIAVYYYGNTTEIANGTFTDFGEFDTTVTTTKMLNFTVKNTGNTPLNLTWCLDTLNGFQILTGDPWYERIVNTVNVWELAIRGVNRTTLDIFICEGSTMTPTPVRIQKIALAVGQTVDLSLTLACFTQTTISESITFTIDLKGSA